MIIERSDYKVNWLSDIEKVSKLRRDVYHRTEPWLCNVCEKVWQGETSRMIEYLADFPKIGCSHRSCHKCKEEK